MTTRSAVDDFLSQKKIALAGVSRKGNKFGNAILKDLSGKGYEIFPVHPEAQEINETRCFASLNDLPNEVDGLITVVPPSETEKLVTEASEAGIKKIWMQQGSESPEVVSFCEEKGLSVIHGECILMFAEPAAWYHRFHRWIWKLLGKLPK